MVSSAITVIFGRLFRHLKDYYRQQNGGDNRLNRLSNRRRKRINYHVRNRLGIAVINYNNKNLTPYQ